MVTSLNAILPVEPAHLTTPLCAQVASGLLLWSEVLALNALMPLLLLVLTVPLTLQPVLLDILLSTLFVNNVLTTVKPVEGQELVNAISAALATSYSMV